ncbi:MAG TPA: diacylglycerol kinase family protein [Ornithinimicrobium sp.]|uniref:diacylglycerol/lipid kinase family protein n=1 Tax=Ornithinimicrobium sp. TaxID=1977084 RepID=UPI002B4A6AAF|nr:diacylglycerol kinase family protein [Ornithinimicrobium sp.]HKJ11466.1 diacylglycerol kinase family protein [Ornithinimicrobium sp.]
MPSDLSWVYLTVSALVVVLLIALVWYFARTEAEAVEATGLAGGASKSGQHRADRRRQHRTGHRGEQERPRAAVIVNPTKFEDIDEVRAMLRRMCATEGWADPLWLQTTVEDPGGGQARQALEAGVDVVCPLGGDGTVRAVASALVETGVPIGLLPGGTGNLLARNLELPVDSLRRSMAVVLSGRDAPIDTCTVTLTRPDSQDLEERREDPGDRARNVDFADATDTPPEVPSEQRYVFLVMAGLGFDAEVMATAPEDLKAQIGWGAYVLAGAQHLQGPQFDVDVRLAEGHHEHRRVRSVICGNVGKLQGGFELLPEARSDDGLVTALLLYPRGLFGWASIARRLVTKRDFPGPQPRLKHLSSRRIRVRSSKPVEVQVDGDPVGSAVTMDVQANPGSLVVRLPQEQSGQR